jgi:DNA mismatch repair protein MSH5
VKSSAWNPDVALEVMCTKLAINSPQGHDAEGDSAKCQYPCCASWLRTIQKKFIECCGISLGHASRRSYLQLVSAIDLESTQLKQSMGALLNYLQTNIFNMDDGMIMVSDVRQLDLISYLRIDSSSFRALQIFAEEKHPEVIKGVGRSKEGFSLFGLFDRTRSLPGRQCLREWMMKPFCDKERIASRQDGVAMTTRSTNLDFVADISKLLRKIHDIPRMLLRIKKVEATHVEWCRLYSSLEAALPILDIMTTFENDTENRVECDRDFIHVLLEGVNIEVPHSVFERLQCAVDFQESMEKGTTTIKDGYDTQLDHMRNVYDSLENFLTQAAHQILEIVPLLQNISVEYVPQIGYLVAVSSIDALLLQPHVKTIKLRSSHKRQRINLDNVSESDRDADGRRDRSIGIYSNQDFHDDVADESDCHQDRFDNRLTDNFDSDEGSEDEEDGGFQFIYAQGDSCYYKHKIVKELDDTIGDVQSSITDRQRTLLLEVEDGLLDAEAPLQQLAAMLSRIDAFISLGVIATEMDFVRPEIVDESVIIIKEGRHLLQELTVDGTFVPNDTFISADKNVALITGPNSSGKSVYLKQVGLLVYLAHIGSWLPCTKAVIGLTDRIMTRISSYESVAAAQSSFSLDLGQVAKMLKTHTSRTLCLIDEFGKGTTPVDGIALLATTIKHFTTSKAKAIFVLHFTEILHPDILDGVSMQSINTFSMETHKPLKTASKGIRGEQREEDNSDNDFNDSNEDEGDIKRDGKALKRNDGYGFGTEEGEEIMPLFRLKLGAAPSSDGIACAKNAGVSYTKLYRFSNCLVYSAL